MKTKFYWIALLVSAAMITQANAGGHGGGGGGRGGFGGGGPRGAPSGRYAAGPGFYGGRSYYGGQRFSAYGMRQYPSAYRSGYPGSNRVGVNRAFNGSRQFSRSGQFGNRNNLSGNGRNHVVAQHSANWHRDWDRGRDHFFNGHRFRFVNGAWFDFGFDPWWPYDYPYDYYGYNYPYGYDPGYYDAENYQGQGYDSNEGNYGSYDQSAGSTVAVVQAQLAKQGYYRGQIDGVLGSQTQRAIANYQNDHGLRATGSLTTDTLRTLGLRRVASN